MKLFTTSALALCMLVLIGCAEGDATSPEAADKIANASNKVQANITGMDCTGCSSSVVAAVEAIDGVEAASADVASGDVTVALKDDADAEVAKAEVEKVIAELQDGKYTVKTIMVSTAAADDHGHDHPHAEGECCGSCKADKKEGECCGTCKADKTQAEKVIETVKEEVEDVVKEVEIPSIGG